LRRGIEYRTRSAILWHREVTHIQEPDQLLSDEFADVFGDTFDTIEFSLDGILNLSDLVDRIEELDDDRLSIDYDHDITTCTLSIEGLSGEIRVTTNSFEIVKDNPQRPNLLLQSLFDIQRVLIDTYDVRVIPFEQRKELE
jgi:hypothetical protein